MKALSRALLLSFALSRALLLSFALPLLGAAPEPVRGTHGMVVSDSEIAARVGIEVLRRGGNAVDAAVAVGFAMAVTFPSAGNLGGGGFMLVRTADGTCEALDYRERAPLAAHRTMYLDAEGKVVPKLSSQGWKAVAVPGTVAGLMLAHKRHGTLKWADLVEPARKLAAEGFVVNGYTARGMASKAIIERMAPFAESRRIYQRDGRFYSIGDTFVQPELAATLARIKTRPRDFYEGEIARTLVAAMKANGGLISAEDLKTYEPTVRQPLRGSYRGYEILTMPPPSSGGIALLEMLHMLETKNLRELGWGSAQYTHLVIEVMRRAFADRAAYLGDTDFVQVPVAKMLTKEYAQSRLASFRPDAATPSRELRGGNPAGYESPDTTHYTIVDAAGMIVSNTYTLNDSYGSGVTVKGLGFLLNNEMDDFTARPGVPNEYELIQGEANAIAPKKRPLSSMTPTIVLKDGKPFLALGSPGGPTIINGVLQTILNVIDFGMDPQLAVIVPRFHHQWLPDHIYWEHFGFSPDTQAILTKLGHTFRDKPGFSELDSIADVHAVMFADGVLLGAADPRRGGAAVGLSNLSRGSSLSRGAAAGSAKPPR